MYDQLSDFSRLTLRIQHLLDAELLLETEAVDLLTEAQAARQACEQGESGGGQRHLEAVIALTQALIRSGLLAADDAQPLLAIASDLLNRGTSPAAESL